MTAVDDIEIDLPGSHDEVIGAPQNELLDRLAAVPRPPRLLSRADTEALTERQRQILDELGAVLANGFDHLTMADIARSVGCSLRTLYSLAESRERLVSIVVDRRLWAIGRAAHDALTPELGPLDAIRVYLRAANVAVVDTTPGFAADIAAHPETLAINEAHNHYLIAATRVLLDAAVGAGEIAPCNTAAVARVVAGLGRDFARPEALAWVGGNPKAAADELVDVILRGLAT